MLTTVWKEKNHMKPLHRSHELIWDSGFLCQPLTLMCSMHSGFFSFYQLQADFFLDSESSPFLATSQVWWRFPPTVRPFIVNCSGLSHFSQCRMSGKVHLSFQIVLALIAATWQLKYIYYPPPNFFLCSHFIIFPLQAKPMEYNPKHISLLFMRLWDILDTSASVLTQNQDNQNKINLKSSTRFIVLCHKLNNKGSSFGLKIFLQYSDH